MCSYCRCSLAPTPRTRLADATHSAAAVGVLIDEVTLRGDDASRVGADERNVGELDRLGVSGESPAQQVDLLAGLDDQHRLAGGEAVADERNGALEEGGRISIEECLVAKRDHSCSPPQIARVGASAQPTMLSTRSSSVACPCRRILLPRPNSPPRIRWP